MSGSSNFLVFDENKSNIMPDSDYTASTYRQYGAIPGKAPSNIHNKLYRQTSIMAAALAQVFANKGYTVSDDDFNALVTVLSHISSDSDLNTHKTANPIDHPADSVTDTVIGDRTVVDNTALTTYTANLTTLLSGIFYMLKSITGKSDGKTIPATSLETLNTHISSIAAHGNIVSAIIGMFGKTQPTLTALIDWDTMKTINSNVDVRNINNTTTSVVAYGGDATALNYSDIILKQDFSTFDALLIKYTDDTGVIIRCKLIAMWEFLIEFTGKQAVMLISDHYYYWSINGNNAATNPSTVVRFNGNGQNPQNCGMVEIYGVTYSV